MCQTYLQFDSFFPQQNTKLLSPYNSRKGFATVKIPIEKNMWSPKHFHVIISSDRKILYPNHENSQASFSKPNIAEIYSIKGRATVCSTLVYYSRCTVKNGAKIKMFYFNGTLIWPLFAEFVELGAATTKQTTTKIRVTYGGYSISM